MGPQGARLPAEPRRGHSGHAAEAGVSAVIGMVLILAISVLGIVAVTNWGLPVITEMKASVEYQGILDQFNGLDGSLQKLIAHTTGQTTYKWQPSINQGAIDVNQTGSRWMVAVDVRPEVNVTWSSLNPATPSTGLDNAVAIKTNASIPNFRFRAWQWLNGAAVELRVNVDNTCSTLTSSNPLAAGTYTYVLHTNSSSCTSVNVNNVVLTFSLNSEPASGAVTVYHQAFLADVGEVHWNGITGQSGPRQAYHSNGVIYSGHANNLVAQTPSILAPPRDYTNSAGVSSTGLYARFAKINGTGSFSGVGAGEHYSIYMNFVGSFTLGTLDNVTAVEVYVWGRLQAPTYTQLTSTVAGYKFVAATDQIGSVNESFLRHKEGSKPFKFSATYSLIQAQV